MNRYEHMPKHQAPELRRGGYGLHTGEKVSPGPPDIFNLGQLLLGMTCLKDYLPYVLLCWRHFHQFITSQDITLSQQKEKNKNQSNTTDT